MTVLQKAFFVSVVLLGAGSATPANAQYEAPPYGYGQGWGPSEPIVRINPGGWGTVNLRNGCVVTFNRDGRRISSSRSCTGPMEGYAADAFRRELYGDYRRNWRDRRDDRRWNRGWNRPQVQWWGGNVRVDFPGVSCSYIYSRSGEHLQTLGNRCSSEMRRAANEAQTAFRRGGRW